VSSGTFSTRVSVKRSKTYTITDLTVKNIYKLLSILIIKFSNINIVLNFSKILNIMLLKKGVRWTMELQIIRLALRPLNNIN
jgi:hypothetical protein